MKKNSRGPSETLSQQRDDDWTTVTYVCPECGHDWASSWDVLAAEALGNPEMIDGCPTCFALTAPKGMVVVNGE